MRLNAVILGAIAMASWVAAMFFLRFWKNTRDRFFLFFAVAFFAEAVNRAVLGLTTVSKEQEPFFYLARLFAFGLILVAVVDKNRVEKWPKKATRKTAQPSTRSSPY